MSEIPKTRRRTKSREWFTRAQESLVEGVNSPSRGRAVYSLGPIVIERGAGSRVFDVDWNEYIDFMMAFGALIHGHAHPAIVEAATLAMSEGTHFAACTAAEIEAAERVCRMVPTAERVRFTNTGSEATMLALRLARAHTGRTKFLKFEGQYHGWYDAFLLNAHAHPAEQLGTPEAPARIPDSAGIPESTFADVVLAPWNDVAALERVFRQHGSELRTLRKDLREENESCGRRVDALGNKFDKMRERGDARYRKIIMALTLAAPSLNPHGDRVLEIVREMAEDNSSE